MEAGGPGGAARLVYFAPRLSYLYKTAPYYDVYTEYYGLLQELMTVPWPGGGDGQLLLSGRRRQEGGRRRLRLAGFFSLLGSSS